VIHGSGGVTAGTNAFSVAVTYPRIAGEPPAMTSPEELLAASHATCFGIGLRSVIAQRSGSAERVRVTATITADKGSRAIRIQSSHLDATIEGLAGVEPEMLPELARTAEEGCTISAAIRGSVAISVDVRAL
jgi:osmotically inducible protein OsmC